MFCFAVAGLVVPVVLIVVGILALAFALVGALFGLLWPLFPIILGAALLWRCARRHT